MRDYATEVVTTIAVFSFLAGVVRWLIAAWFQGIKDQRTSPTSTSLIVDASMDVVDVLRKQLGQMSVEIDRMQVELLNVRNLLSEVERQREEWRDRAIALGWTEPTGPAGT